MGTPVTAGAHTPWAWPCALPTPGRGPCLLGRGGKRGQGQAQFTGGGGAPGARTEAAANAGGLDAAPAP